MDLNDILANCFKEVPGISAVILFGSYATHSARPDSDLDIAVLFKHPDLPNTMQQMTLREKIADITGKSIDLVCLNTCSPIIGMLVYKYGHLIAVPDRKTYDQHLMRLFTDYCDLKRLRRDAENNILSRRLYG